MEEIKTVKKRRQPDKLYPLVLGLITLANGMGGNYLYKCNHEDAGFFFSGFGIVLGLIFLIPILVKYDRENPKFKYGLILLFFGIGFGILTFLVKALIY